MRGRWIWIPVLLLAAATGRAGTLSVEEAVDRVLRRHPGLAAARAAAQRAEARHRQARAALRPGVSLDGSYAYTGPVPEIRMDPGIPGIDPIVQELGDEHNARLAATAGWRLWDGGVRTGRMEALEAAWGAARLQEEETRSRLALEVRLLALGLLLAGETREVVEGSLATAREHARQTEARFGAGLGTDLERTRAGVRVAELEALRVEAAELEARLRAELAVLLGMPGEEPAVSGSLGDLARRELAPGDPVEEHPLVRSLTEATRSARGWLTAARGSRHPSVDLGASAGVEYPFYFEDEWSETYRVGLSIAYPLYVGGARRGRIAEAEAAAGEAEARRELGRETLRRQAAAIRAEHARSLAALEAARVREEQARRYLRAAETGAAAGLATDLDVRDAEAALDAARLERCRTQYEICAVDARWTALLGRARDPSREREVVE